MTSKKKQTKTDKKEKWNVRVEEELCSGCTSCVAFAPKIFEAGSNGIVCVRADCIIDDLGAVIAAGENCPNCAIIIEDTENGEIYS